MPSNIEIKARARNPARLQAMAAVLSGAPGTLLYQEDTFFRTPHGRLKLRMFSSTQGELIYYERDDTSGPKPSHYTVVPTSDPEALKALLTVALGVRGVIRKQRLLYRIGQTRVHLDDVEALGTFVELEWVMSLGQPLAEGTRIVAELMQQFEIADTDLVRSAYIDLLTATHGTSDLPDFPRVLSQTPSDA